MGNEPLNLWAWCEWCWSSNDDVL